MHHQLRAANELFRETILNATNRIKRFSRGTGCGKSYLLAHIQMPQRCPPPYPRRQRAPYPGQPFPFPAAALPLSPTLVPLWLLLTLWVEPFLSLLLNSLRRPQPLILNSFDLNRRYLDERSFITPVKTAIMFV